MVERGELITLCRQMGGMMEAGVDILRITRVLRAQTTNPRLLQLYDSIDHDLTMGRSIADAMAHAPDVFSPFAVSLVQQGEMRNDIAGSFLRLADFLQKDEEVLAEAQSQREAAERMAQRAGRAADDDVLEAEVAVEAVGRGPGANEAPLPGSPLTVIALDGLIDRLQTLGLRALTILSCLLLALAAVRWSVELGIVERRYLTVTLYSVAALFMGAAGVWVQRRIEADRRRETRCSFCGTLGTGDAGLQPAPRFAGAAICPRCAAIAAQRMDTRPADTRHEDANGAEGESAAPASPPAMPAENAGSEAGATPPTAPAASIAASTTPPSGAQGAQNIGAAGKLNGRATMPTPGQDTPPPGGVNRIVLDEEEYE